MSGSSAGLGWFLRFDPRGLLVPVALMIGLEALVQFTGFTSSSIASPSQVALAFLAVLKDGSLFSATWQTLGAAAGGVAIGGLIGLTLGLLFGLFPLVHAMLDFTTELVRPIPSIALLPVALLVFGFGYTMEISLVAKSAIWPVLFVTHAAITGIDSRLLEVASLLGMKNIEKVYKIILPSVVPAFFVGVRLAVGVSILVSIAVEITANPRGLGYAMMRAEETQRPDLMFAYLLWIGCVGWSVNAALVLTHERLFSRFGTKAEVS